MECMDTIREYWKKTGFDRQKESPVSAVINLMPFRLGGTDGHRADIGMIKTARALAALSGRKKVAEEDIEKAASYVLPHRMRKNPLDEGNMDQNEIQQLLAKKRNQGTPKEPKGTKEGD